MPGGDGVTLCCFSYDDMVRSAQLEELVRTAFALACRSRLGT
jgi:hypothetical protein